MLYVVCSSYSPGTPGENRFDGICRGIVRQGYAITRVFIRPDKECHMANDKESGILYKYLWNGKSLKTGKWRHLQQICWLYFFLRSLAQEDKVIVTHSDYLFIYSRFPKLHIYHEKSEYPELHYDTMSWAAKQEIKIYISTCRKLDGIFPISNALKDYFISKGVSNDRIQVVNMTVDLSRFNGLKKEPVENKYIAYCGAVSNYKDGVDVLIKAFAIVSKQIKDIKLLIIGDFPFTKDKEDDCALVEGYGLCDRIVFTGYIPREDMPQMLKNAEALVLARPDNIQAKYGFPTKLGEYLLTENPVVVTKVGEIPMFLEDGVSAYIAEPNNIEEIASKMKSAITSPIAAHIGKEGALVAKREFNCDLVSKKIIDFIYGKK